MTPDNYPGYVLSTILRHDAKTTSYKIALLRALGDIALAYPQMEASHLPVAIPVRVIAEFWLAYYWPFADVAQPIWQGARNRRASGQVADMAFRASLTELKTGWERVLGTGARPSDGYLLINDMGIARKRGLYAPAFVQAYDDTVAAIAKTVQQPIRYAGPGQWSVFPRPIRLHSVSQAVVPLPAAHPSDLCLILRPELWLDFQQLSLWIEALCIHEWSLFTERVDPNGGRAVTRGEVYELLTDRPDNRRPLSWERNQVDILLMEGHAFQCPWTSRRIEVPGSYDLDHVIPVAVYPLNEMWNLVPSDPHFNQRTKRDRMPSSERLQRALPIISTTYDTYMRSPALASALRDDSAARFLSVHLNNADLPAAIANATRDFVERIALGRNLARF